MLIKMALKNLEAVRKMKREILQLDPKLENKFWREYYMELCEKERMDVEFLRRRGIELS